MQCGSSFVPSPSDHSFPSASLKCGLTYEHTCLLKETKHVVAVGAYDMSDQLSWPHLPWWTVQYTYVHICMYAHTVQTKFNLERTSVGLAHTHSIRVCNSIWFVLPSQQYDLSNQQWICLTVRWIWPNMKPLLDTCLEPPRRTTCDWGERERAPHRRVVREPCLCICMYVCIYVPYVLP